jgi:hypothetical protein
MQSQPTTVDLADPVVSPTDSVFPVEFPSLPVLIDFPVSKSILDIPDPSGYRPAILSADEQAVVAFIARTRHSGAYVPVRKSVPTDADRKHITEHKRLAHRRLDMSK